MSKLVQHLLSGMTSNLSLYIFTVPCVEKGKEVFELFLCSLLVFWPVKNEVSCLLQMKVSLACNHQHFFLWHETPLQVYPLTCPARFLFCRKRCLQRSIFEVLMPLMSQQLDLKSCARRDNVFSGFYAAIPSRVSSYFINTSILEFWDDSLKVVFETNELGFSEWGTRSMLFRSFRHPQIP